jgi:hypothetical protein
MYFKLVFFSYCANVCAGTTPFLNLRMHASNIPFSFYVNRPKMGV